MGASASIKSGSAHAIDFRLVSFMLLNFASSTGIVVLNKIVMDHLGFAFATTLTGFHFVMTFLCLLLTSAIGVFKIKKLPLAKVMKLAAGTTGFVVLTNLSLQHNSIGFYQIMKVMTTPMVVILEALVYRKYLEGKLRLALVPVCLGVILTTTNDYRLNMVGTAYAIAGVIVTSFYQIWSGTLQKSLNCSALQLMVYTSPMSALLILPFLPIFDNYSTTSPAGIWNFAINDRVIGGIFATGFIAFLVNISIFLIIGKSSPLTYNILGHTKTCFILLMDFALFGRPMDMRNTAGILLALVGVTTYTHLKLEKARKEREAVEASQKEMDPSKEERIELLPKGEPDSSGSYAETESPESTSDNENDRKET